MIRKILFAAVLGASLGGIATTAAAAPAIYVQIAPPEPRYEAVPAPRHGHVWAPGYWDWRGNRHQWHAGSWQRERPGYNYQESKWVQHDNGRWSREQGRWARGDRDRDGIPNRADRDRDGDGVPTHRDRHPDNPRRN